MLSLFVHVIFVVIVIIVFCPSSRKDPLSDSQIVQMRLQVQQQRLKVEEERYALFSVYTLSSSLAFTNNLKLHAGLQVECYPFTLTHPL
jgi:hypothetical protein